MEIIIKNNGKWITVDVSAEVYEYLDCAKRKEENLAHEKRRYWDYRELDEYIILTEGSSLLIKHQRNGIAIRKRLKKLRVC